MANRITVILEALGFDKGAAQVKGFSQSIKDADGVGGKFKAGWQSATDSVKANAGALATAGGAALVAFGIKAAEAFTSTAKAAIDLGAATGLATEDASRWIAVGDDMGVTAEQLTSSLGRIGKTLDGESWEKYGIATRDAGGEARSTNDILLDALDMLGKVTNETERAKIGNELFGKGYANLAPLIGNTRAEYQEMLGAVEDGQVITSKEAAKAERLRLAQDALADALQEVTLATGELVAELSPAIEQTSKMVGWAIKLADKLGAADVAARALAGALGGPLGAAYQGYQSALDKAVKSADDQNRVWQEQGLSLKEIRDKWQEMGFSVDQVRDLMHTLYVEAGTATDGIGGLGDAVEAFQGKGDDTEETLIDVAKATRETRDEFEKAADAADSMRSALDKLTGTGRTMEQASQDWEAGVDDLNAAFKENGATLDKTTEQGRANRDAVKAQVDTLLNDLIPALVESGLSNEEAGDHALAYRNALFEQMVQAGLSREEAEEYINTLGLTPDVVRTAIELADKDKILAELRDVLATLDQIEIPRRANISVSGRPGAGASGGKKRASGGPTWAGEAFEINERNHPEVLTEGGRTYLLPGGDGQVTPLAPVAGNNGGAGGTMNVTINMPPGSNGDDVVRAIREYERRNGPGWRGGR